MSAYSTARLSSKGQIVIPEEIRESLHLKEGDQFLVIGKGDTVVFKSIMPPNIDEFGELMAEARKQAKTVKMKKSDILTAVKKVRQKSR